MRVQSGFLEVDDNETSMYVLHSPVDVFFDEPSRTRQEFADECDINVLMARYEKTGVISHVAQREPMYLDLSGGVPDLQTALHTVMVAEQAFMTLPASVRKEFDNDPLKFVAFAEDANNLDKMREFGLAPPLPPETPPLKVEVVASDPPAGGPSPAAAG